MPRQLTPAFIAAIQAKEVYPALLLRGEFDSGNLLLWTGLGQIEVGGETYTGAGTLLGIDPVEETASIQSTGTKLTLSGISSQVVSLAMQEPYQGRLVEIWLALFTAGNVLIDDPSILFSGRADQMVLSDEGTTCSIVLTAENRFVDLQRARIRKYEDQDQKIDYPADRGFEFLSVIQDVPLKWGAA